MQLRPKNVVKQSIYVDKMWKNPSLSLVLQIHFKTFEYDKTVAVIHKV